VEEKESAQFWRALKPGSTISLKDAQALEDSMKAGLGVSARDYVVREVRSIKQLEGPVEWQLFNVEDGEERLWFLVKIVDEDIALRMYFEVEGLQPGTRSEMIEREMSWLFQEPKDPDDFRCNELGYAEEIIQAIEEDGEEKEIRFRIKPQGELHGACTHEPQQSWPQVMMATVVEYASQQACANPELLLLELGGESGEDGGVITLFQGCDVRFSEVDVLAV
jgi:hypothetical protein